jgi:hypothetical protein
VTDPRPCQYCVAVWASMARPDLGHKPIRPDPQDCEWEHRDDPRVYDLARAMAKVFQDRRPSDAQIGYFLANANEIVDDFDPAPETWRVRRVRGAKEDQYDGIEVRMRINDVTYVGLEGGKGDRGALLRLSEFRAQQREANAGAR